MISLLEELKRCFAKEYNIKDLKKIKKTIRWQISRDTTLYTIKINQSAFIRDLVIEKGLTKCNPNVILMKTGSVIDISEVRDYEGINLQIYQRLIGKLIYLTCGIRPDIVFVIG